MISWNSVDGKIYALVDGREQKLFAGSPRVRKKEVDRSRFSLRIPPLQYRSQKTCSKGGRHNGCPLQTTAEKSCR